MYLCVFMWIWEQTAIISLYSIKWMGFITETEYVYCSVRAGSLNIISVNLVFVVFLWRYSSSSYNCIVGLIGVCHISSLHKKCPLLVRGPVIVVFTEQTVVIKVLTWRQFGMAKLCIKTRPIEEDDSLAFDCVSVISLCWPALFEFAR